eukprot:549688-Pleurochrysis_carterae.AAC.2
MLVEKLVPKQLLHSESNARQRAPSAPGPELGKVVLQWLRAGRKSGEALSEQAGPRGYTAARKRGYTAARARSV